MRTRRPEGEGGRRLRRQREREVGERKRAGETDRAEFRLRYKI